MKDHDMVFFSIILVVTTLTVNIIAINDGRWNLLLGQSLLVIPFIAMVLWGDPKE